MPLSMSGLTVGVWLVVAYTLLFGVVVTVKEGPLELWT